jgi:hypothetical protein
MKTIAGAILVLAGAVCVHAAATDSRGFEGFAMLAGVGVGILGLIVVAMSFSSHSSE